MVTLNKTTIYGSTFDVYNVTSQTEGIVFRPFRGAFGALKFLIIVIFMVTLTI